MPRNRLIFWGLLLAQIWLAHAIAFFFHEYGHSLTAWALGFKADPWLLNFGGLSASNLLFMSEIDENVDYGPVFAGGHGPYASLIAAAGVLSNAVLYVAALLLYRMTKERRQAWALFFFWLCVMCAGNFITYVPTRTFSPGQDLNTVERGLAVSPWMVLLVLGVPFLIGLLYLLMKLLPDARRSLFPQDRGRQMLIVILTTFLLFVFFALGGLEAGSGLISNRLALFSIFGLFPLVTILCRPGKKPPLTAEALIR